MPRPVEQDSTYPTPEIDPLLTYKGVWVLCSLNADGDRLKATHYASCLTAGAFPVWGVWLVSGKFVRFHSYRSEIEAAYPRLVWRRKMATWGLRSIDNKSIAERRDELQRTYNRRVPTPKEDK